MDNKSLFNPKLRHFEDCKKDGYKPINKIVVEDKKILDLYEGWFVSGVLVDDSHPHEELIVTIEKDHDEGDKEGSVKVLDTDYYDKEEVIENCTVQILTNTVTGETSVGWWRQEV